MLVATIVIGVLFLFILEILLMSAVKQEKSSPPAKNPPMESKPVGTRRTGKFKTNENFTFDVSDPAGDPIPVKNTFDIDNPDAEFKVDPIVESRKQGRELYEQREAREGALKEQHKERARRMADYAHRVNFGLKSRFDPYKE